MHIDNIRLGFACNSSSAHSLIFNATSGLDDVGRDQRFGWNEWCASTNESKMGYLAQTLAANLRTKLPGSVIRAICKQWLGVDLADGSSSEGTDGYIDHQSIMSLPVDAVTGTIDYDFLMDFAEYLRRDNIGIVGGSDESPHERFMVRHAFPLPKDGEGKGILVPRKDGDWWIIFNRKTGAKIALSFAENPKLYMKAQWPELVDLTITDYCPFKCKYCYRGSTQHGEHASTNVIHRIAAILADMRVFEVALGGGEPTMHPEFAYILSVFHEYGIVPNFTTANLAWLRSREIVDAVKEYSGRFAISMRPQMQIDEILSELHMAGFYKFQTTDSSDLPFNLHFVMGTEQTEWYLKEALEHHLSVTLLGYKNVGFGASFNPEPTDRILEFLSESKAWYSISIDTVFAEQHKKWLQSLTSDMFLRYRDGTHSMYIDAVAEKIGPSSYEPDRMEPVENWHLDIPRKFKEWN